MLCALTVRRLKPGTFDQFRKAWEPDVWVEGFTRAYHLRNVRDENEIVSFGFFDGTLEELNARFEGVDPGGRLAEERQRRMAAFVESIGTDSMFEVIDEVTPPAPSRQSELGRS